MKERVLIVEDEAIVALDLAEKIRQIGYEVAGITGWGETAVERARELRPDAMLMDVRLAGEMDGVTAAEEIGRQGGSAVIFLTANSESGIVDRAKQVSSYGFVLKPFEIRELQIALEMGIAKHRAEQALRKSEERFALSMDATQDGLWDWDVTTDAVYFSPSYYRILGYEPGGFPSTIAAWKERIHPGDGERVLQAYEICVAGFSEFFTMEYRLRARTGEWRWILSRGKCVRRDAAGRATRLVGTHVDVTEPKSLEMRLNASLQELREAQDQLVQSERLAVLGKLAGSLAHELRTPLMVIRNAAFYLEGNLGSSDPSVKESFAEIKRALARSNHIVTELLEYVREPSPADGVFALGDAVAQALQQVAIPAGVAVCHLPEAAAGLRVRANVEQVKRALVNLLENAVQAMPGGGKLAIDASRDDAGTVCVAIRDTGGGIPSEDLERIFEPLFSTKVTGIGLGLSIARRCAQHNGGDLYVTSEVGKGSTFQLTLRAAG